MAADEVFAGVKAEYQTTYLRPSRSWLALDLGELWTYRELIYFMTWRDIKVRYKQTALGVALTLAALLYIGDLMNLRWPPSVLDLL